MTPHFKLSEFSSPSRINGRTSYTRRIAVPMVYRPNLRKLANALEVIRKALGNKPIRIASGWRDPAFNSASKGRATKSLHLVAKAADMQVKGVSPARVYWVIWQLQRDGLIPKGGLACYSTFVHYDIRGYNARWRRAPKRPRSGLGRAP